MPVNKNIKSNLNVIQPHSRATALRMHCCTYACIRFKLITEKSFDESARVIRYSQCVRQFIGMFVEKCCFNDVYVDLPIINTLNKWFFFKKQSSIAFSCLTIYITIILTENKSMKKKQ